MAWLSLLWLLLLVAVGGWLLSFVMVTFSLAVAGDARLSPRLRQRRALILASLPWLLPASLVLAMCLIALLKPSGWINDHCLYHQHGHLHLCFAHLPLMNLGLVEAVCVGLIILLLSIHAVRLVRREVKTRRELQTLAGFARGQRRLRILEDNRPFALAVGIVNPLVLFSQGLLQRLSLHERRVVMAHELAHLRHADLLRNMLFEILLCLHLPIYAHRLRRIWLQALEEHADDSAVARFGRDTVAATLLQVIKVSRAHPLANFAAVGADPLVRIRRLLSTQEPTTSSQFFESFHMVVLLLASLLSFVYHHALETLLTWITGG